MMMHASVPAQSFAYVLVQLSYLPTSTSRSAEPEPDPIPSPLAYLCFYCLLAAEMTACKFNVADPIFATLGGSCDQLIASGAARCDGQLANTPTAQEFAHACDRSCGFQCTSCDYKFIAAAAIVKLVGSLQCFLYGGIFIATYCSINRGYVRNSGSTGLLAHTDQDDGKDEENIRLIVLVRKVIRTLGLVTAIVVSVFVVLLGQDEI